MEHTKLIIMQNVHIKKLLVCLAIAFLFFFLIFFANQLLLLSGSRDQLTFFQYFTLILHSIPSAVVMSLLFSTCLGFAYGLIKINFFEMFQKDKRNILPVIILGIIISITIFIIYNFIPPHDETAHSFYLSALNTRFSIPLGSLIFTFFAAALSIVLKNRLKVSMYIVLVSCIIYWAMLMFGQRFSVLATWLPNIVFLSLSIILFFIGLKISPVPKPPESA